MVVMNKSFILLAVCCLCLAACCYHFQCLTISFCENIVHLFDERLFSVPRFVYVTLFHVSDLMDRLDGV
jgi:hypothetical protein